MKTAEMSRIDGGVLYTWVLKAGDVAAPRWAGASPLRMVQVGGVLGGARVTITGTIVPEDGGAAYFAVPTTDGAPCSLGRPGHAALIPLGLWLRPEVAGGDETTRITILLALVNPAHQRPTE